MGFTEQHARLFDMHCHLGFVNDAEAVRRCLAETGVHALSCTVAPAEYEQDIAAFANIAECTVALGLHPWQVADGTVGEAEVERFTELAATTRFIGEIGLDFAGERSEREMVDLQRDALSRALAACNAPSAFPRKLISLHAVRAAMNVLDLLEEHDTFARHDCIFHWFSGAMEDLERAIEAGCFFSVGPRMLAMKRCRVYARIIPEDRLLLETDFPSAPGKAWSCTQWTDQLTETLAALAEIRNASEDELARTIARTSANLLGESTR